MTSTISSINKTNKKNSFFGLVKWSFFSSVPLFVVYCCILALVLPIMIFSAMANEEYSYLDSVFNGIIPVLEVIFVIFFGVILFKDFHNKRSVDLYASFPIKKVTMFMAKYVSGILMLFIPLLVFTFIAGIIPSLFPEPHAVVDGFEEYNTYSFVQPYLPYIMKECLRVFLGVIAAYSMFTVTALLCGTILSTLISYGIVNILYPVLIMLILELLTKTIPGLPSVEDSGLHMVGLITVTALSPVSLMVIAGQVHISSAEEISMSEPVLTLSGYILFCVIFTLVMIAAGCWIAKIRKNENVQNSFINRISKSIVTVFIVATSSIVSGTVFKTGFYHSIDEGTVNATVIFLLGSIVGAILSFLIFTFVYNKGVKGFFKEIPVFCISIGIVFVMVLAVITDCFGIGSYVPKTEDIKSVAIVNDYMSVDLYEQNEYYQFYQNIGAGIPEYVSAEIYYDSDGKAKIMNYHLQDKAVIEKTRQIHQLIIDEVKSKNSPFYTLFGAEERYYETEEYYNGGDIAYRTPYSKVKDIQIQYILTNGKTVTKNYNKKYCMNDEISKLLNEIMSSDTYKQNCFSFMKHDVQHLTDESIQHIFEDTTYTPEEKGTDFYHDEQKLTELYRTFVQDFMNDKNVLDTITKQNLLYRQSKDSYNELSEREDDLILRMVFEQKKRTANKKIDEEYIPTKEEYWYLSSGYINTINLAKKYSNQKISSPNEYVFISRY